MKKIIQLSAILLLFSGWLYAQNDAASQQQRLDEMKSKGTEGSLTIYPVKLMGQYWERVSEIMGVLLEQKGLKNIELSENTFTSKKKLPLIELTDSLKKFVTGHPFKTDYALYIEMNGDDAPPPIDELVGMIVNKSGEVVWTDILNAEDEIFVNVGDPDPMGYSVLLCNQIAPNMGLDAETARNAKPGKFSAMMRERSGLPPEEEMAQMPEREKVMKSNFSKSTLMIFPVRALGEANQAGAEKLAALMNEAGMVKAKASDKFLLLQATKDPNEMRVLWDMAKDFRNALKSDPQDADYFLYADYIFTKDNWQAGYVHFMICDRQGEWVIADLQNSNQEDYIKVKPTSLEDCNRIVMARLEKYLKTSIADVVRETIETSGIEAANSKFKELSPDTKNYLLSEDEINMLGYDYLRAGKNDEAIAVFIMNTEAFPTSFNTFDSLGEAYAAKGDKELAIKNYERSVQLNPDNTNGIEMLKKLKGKL